jgi:hypothetical protein
MKQLILSLSLILLAVGISAQSQTNEKTAQEATEAMTSLYSLDETQVEQMMVIQQRRFRNLAEIESLKNTDEKLYRIKMRSIRKGTEASIKRILKPEQMPTFNAQVAERRKKESELVKEMKLKGASKEEIQTALLGLD